MLESMWGKESPCALPVELCVGTATLGASHEALVIKNPPANAGDMRHVGKIVGWEDYLEESVATLSSILVWRIPWREETGRLQSIALQKIRHD